MATIEKAAHSERGAIFRFFLKHPMVGPIGSAASVISLLVALIVFYVSRERPALTYFVNYIAH
jgi:hypothetical protein